MLKVLKWIGIVLGSLLGLAILGVAIIYFVYGARMERRYTISPEAIAIPTDAASIERGRRLVVAAQCQDCHGENLAGLVTFDDPTMGRIYASNLTAGRGGAGQHFSNADWVRALRHGVGPDGRSLLVTPAQYYYYLSDADVGAIIAYIKALPPVDQELPAPAVGPLGRVLLTVINPPEWLPAEKIDHAAPRPPVPRPGVSPSYGEYLVRTGACMACHSIDGPNISAAPGGGLAAWSDADFIRAMRDGRKPDGQAIDSEEMPLRSLRYHSDDDLRAMLLYLRALPVAEGGPQTNE
jgi:mono/diheme cytochrome c family protein